MHPQRGSGLKIALVDAPITTCHASNIIRIRELNPGHTPFDASLTQLCLQVHILLLSDYFSEVSYMCQCYFQIFLNQTASGVVLVDGKHITSLDNQNITGFKAMVFGIFKHIGD